MGGRPSKVNCPGGEYCITSDDIFMKETAPKKTCVIGAGYVALECAGFVTNLKQGEVVVLVRSILLRGFDRDVVDCVKAYMEAQGTRIMEGVKPERIEKLPNGRFLVHYSTGDKEEFDTVLSAIGRHADTSGLGLENVDLTTDPETGKIHCVDERTAVPNIYAVGDVVQVRRAFDLFVITSRVYVSSFISSYISRGAAIVGGAGADPHGDSGWQVTRSAFIRK